MKYLFFIFFIFFGHLNIYAQYYSGVNPNDSNFVEELETCIRENYVRITYDNYKRTIIPDFESKDNGDGTRNVTCVYTGYKYNYTPPFTWDVFSREHTWCYSWMPSHGDKTTYEYSDQHHLFPVHQNNANLRRSNHPLGKVVNVTYQFLDGKLGTNANGETVYEPRDTHKGDAARALLYMTIRYDGTDGNTWNFDWLNNIKLPELNEASQSLQILLDWNKEDSPDKWEVERNDYIYSKQHNRNPFVDHPEYVSYINFNDLTKLSPVYSPEPENQPFNLSVSRTDTSITITWDDAIPGSQEPAGYLLMAYASDNFFIPMDGVEYSQDTILTDGKALLNIDYDVQNSYTFYDIDSSSDYYFRFYSYNGTNDEINYNINQPASITTEESEEQSTKVFFTEYIEGSSYNKALEIYNASNDTIFFENENYLVEIYINGNSSPNKSILLQGYLPPNDVFVLSHPNAEQQISDVSDQTSSALVFNGDDAIVLKSGSTIKNVIGQVGFDPGSEWGTGLCSTADNTLRMKFDAAPDTNPNDTYEPSEQFNGYGKNDFSDLGNYGGTNPVELSSFTVNVKGNKVELNWATATEVNNYGFEILRSVAGVQHSEWETIGFVEGHGSSNSPKYYSYVDNPIDKGRYSYTLKQIDLDGEFKYSDVVSVDLGSFTKFALKQNYPNPFSKGSGGNPTTEISFDVPKESNVKLSVYNSLGQKVADLVNEKLSSGTHRVKFDGSNLTSGIYFYKMESGGFTDIKKMILMK